VGSIAVLTNNPIRPKALLQTLMPTQHAAFSEAKRSMLKEGFSGNTLGKLRTLDLLAKGYAEAIHTHNNPNVRMWAQGRIKKTIDMAEQCGIPAFLYRGILAQVEIQETNAAINSFPISKAITHKPLTNLKPTDWASGYRKWLDQGGNKALAVWRSRYD
jgi:hypothetical protein